MLSDLNHYALFHPHQINLSEHPKCDITSAPFHRDFGKVKGNLGHEEIWALMVPVFPSDKTVIEKDPHWNIYATGPVITLFFFCWAYNQDTAKELLQLIEQKRLEMLEGGIILSKMSHRS